MLDDICFTFAIAGARTGPLTKASAAIAGRAGSNGFRIRFRTAEQQGDRNRPGQRQNHQG